MQVLGTTNHAAEVSEEQALEGFVRQRNSIVRNAMFIIVYASNMISGHASHIMCVLLICRSAPH